MSWDILVNIFFILCSIILSLATLTECFYWYEYKNSTSSVFNNNKVAWWKLIWRVIETFVSWIVVYLMYPFVRLLAKPLVDKNGKKPPLILVHGLFHNASTWFFYKLWFKKAGYTRVHLYSYPVHGKELWGLTKYLEKAVSEVESLYPGEKPILIGMSLGGLMIRGWMSETDPRVENRENGTTKTNHDRIRAVITLGTPHSGSKLAAFGIEKTSRSLSPSGPFFKELVAKESITKSEWIPKIALYSLADNLVLPTDNLMPPSEWNKDTLPQVTHVAMMLCKRTFNKMLGHLNKLPDNSNSFENNNK
ncbi:lipase family alpha/beta hydrolase [Desulfovibrio litoralis]|uniref:Alpha/beta hydrolase family protein n=1 Tax=Desulfovibrio litoralis DSM 11393 TaxID=1121455 RepID=A0A1M7RVC5_9BACT|nr:alpha/beta fold hydrolase [Desulfovibrio litoralis]SHN50096.1 Alpha/beta hydrolase family protein [Desulfovibrio litoralis DSM 11393]